MTQSDTLSLLAVLQVVIQDSHIVYTSGRHGGVYVNKDRVYPFANAVCELTAEMAGRWMHDPIDVVVAPAIGGVILSTWVTFHLQSAQHRAILGLYAEKETVAIPDPGGLDRECFMETGRFVLKRGYDKLIMGQNVLIVEDVLTTGGTVRKVMEAVRRHEGNVVGVMALCNRGGVTASDVGDVPRLDALVNTTLESWDAEHCPLCAQGVPINTELGKGAEYVARHGHPIRQS